MKAITWERAAVFMLGISVGVWVAVLMTPVPNVVEIDPATPPDAGMVIRVVEDIPTSCTTGDLVLQVRYNPFTIALFQCVAQNEWVIMKDR